ncbi:MAG: hypothetical protein ACJ8G7_16130 [Rhizobacter sp.]
MKPLFTFARLAMHDRRPGRSAIASPLEHLLAAERWLCRAHDVSSNGGVSYGYTLRRGWGPSYPETSGYIAPTFFRLARQRDPAYLDRARRVVQWLLTVQNPDGSIPNPRYGQQGIVFDTGQVLFGLVCGYEALGDPALLAGARKAANWLVAIADPQRRWTRNEHLGTPHVYNTRTAWALLRMNELEFDPAREAVARSNLDWAIEEQLASGFYEHCAFQPGRPPFTHTIAYTTRGLLECGLLLDEPRFLEAAVRCADATLLHLREDGFLPSTIAPDGRAAASSCCLTGNCQFAIIWTRLAAVCGSSRYRDAAARALSYVMSTQDLQTGDNNVRGAIKGSQPIWGKYAPMSFPNWAAKFFIDAMVLQQELER